MSSDLAGSIARTSNAVDCAAPELDFGGIVFETGVYELYLDDIVIE